MTRAVGSSAVRTISVKERRARLALRHHLAPSARAKTAEAAAAGVVVLHATDPATIVLSVGARIDGDPIAAVERALYDERSLVRILGMRRTLFVVPSEIAPIVHGASTRALAVTERKRVVNVIEDGGISTDGAAWLRAVETRTLAALERRGEATASELRADVPELGEQLKMGVGKKWEGTFSISTRVLWLLAMDGHVVRGRPRGSWLSTQYRWAAMDRWLGRRIDDEPTEGAQVELARRWLAAFGPGTVADLRWWTGWTARDATRALAALDTVAVDLDGVPGLVLADDEGPVASPRPWAALLPALDPTVMGWTGRDWYLGEHKKALFDRSGNAGPTVWWDGRIIGGWSQRASGEVVARVLDDIGSAGTKA
ncbi:MAG: hypothetical protein QOD72_1449, partial [Acidimicrobiaceae bacterium]|nr:hypothetical protein [Acidimicrobiaceae bacterium]